MSDVPEEIVTEEVVTEEVKPAPKRKKSKFFVNNYDLLTEYHASRKRLEENPSLGYGGAMTRHLTLMFIHLVDRYASKRNWADYSYLSELKGQAMVNLCEKWHTFDPNRNPAAPNPFAYYTAMVQNAFRGQILKEKKPQKVKDAILVSMGLTPSYGAQLDGDEFRGYYDRQNEAIKNDDDSGSTNG